MPRNIEIKAVATDFARQKSRAADLADGPPVLIEQRDTFFHVPRGRLKLRELAEGRAELIQYAREDRTDAKTSTYTLYATADPATLKRALADALGVRGQIVKRRCLFLAGRTRIHFDEVEGLGQFVELEVVMQPGESDADGQREAERLMQQLEIRNRDLIDAAYIDLVERRSAGS